MGGEKERLAHCAGWAEGSPPRGRGKGTLDYARRNGMRITPAWAGKSNLYHEDTKANGDHPRVGGEKRNSRKP